ncbi:hypothetical protein ACFSO7_06610 [Bacillus sp. CGMCC 1.16607]
MAKQYVVSHNGKIEVKSIKGTTFIIHLPSN